METYLSAEHRFDYAKFVIRAPQDLCETYRLRFIELISCGDEFEGANSGYNVKPLRKHSDGQWTYVMEIWGPLAQVVRYFNWETWSKLLERIDIKFEHNISQDGVKALREHLENTGAGGRNVQTFNSRVRSKKEGRDAGGFGVAVGSHKSDSRLTAYRRGKEQGCVEYQLSGKRIETGVGVVNMLRSNGHKNADVDPWAELRQQMFTTSVVEYKKITGLTFQEFTDLLETGNADTPVERSLRVIEQHVSNLDKEGLMVVQAYVQQHLFAA